MKAYWFKILFYQLGFWTLSNV